MDVDLTAEILRNALVLAAEEASIVVVRSAYSTFIVEGSDASAAILDADGRLVAQSTATTLAHATSLSASLPHLLAEHPADTMAPGDVFAMNDVFRGGIHANDVIVFEPVFVGAVPAYFTGTLIHVSDLGGAAAGGMASSATEVFHEGLQLPPVRLATAAGTVGDVTRILAANSRTPEAVLGDVHALMAGTTVARRRMEEILAEHGADELARGVAAYLDYTETRMRRAIAQIPDAVYRGEYPIDGDGIDPDRAYRIVVTLTVAGDEVTIDFTGTDEQVAAAINSGFSQTMSGALYALRCFVDPGIPMNDGCLRPVRFVLPFGSLVNPRPPAACGGRAIAMFAIIDAIAEALSDAVPERAVAGSGILTGFSISPARPDGVPWVHMAYELGGMGGRYGKDGPDGAGPHFGIGRNTIPQVEPVELRCPLLVEAVECRTDSGGPGRWRGGLGIRTTFRLLADSVVTMRTDRHRFPPPGKNGGEPGGAGGYYRLGPDGRRERLPDKATGIRLRAGERFVVESSGGGGLGAPAERDPAAVAADVRDGLVSAEAARASYGVEVAP